MPRRRRHEVASWWMPAAPAEQAVDTIEVEKKDVKIAEREPARHHEGMIVSSLKEGENWVTLNDVNHEPKISITHGLIKSSGGKGAFRKEGKIEADQVPGHGKQPISSDPTHLPVLCIDVDNTTKCAAVKDIRDTSNLDSDASKLEFFVVRRKRLRETKSDGKKDSKVSLKEDATCESDEMSSSGYTTDDEKDDAEDILHEETSRIKSNGDQAEPLPEEIDADPDGNLLYEQSEHLPPRQLRVLRDGDRILMRYTPPTAINSSPRIAKLEYIYARKKHSHSRQKDHHRMKAAVETTPGRPRLLSVKSDVKSDWGKKFKANDTSAAEAPSDDDISIKATKDHHKAGKDWSAVDDAAGNGGDKAKNDQEEDNMEEMEEYSYLTGEIVMKDQDYVSALTGDEATMTPHAPVNDGRLRGGNDAATASAVVVGANNRAVSSPGNHRTGSPKGKKEKEVSFDAKFSPKKTSPKGKGDCEFQVTGEVKEGNHQETFFTANTNEEDEELSMEEELLSQPSAAHESPKKGGNDGEYSDISQTQPLPPGFFNNNHNEDSNSSLSAENPPKKKEVDEDESTACSGPEYQLPSQVNVSSPKKGEVRFSQLTPNSKASKRGDESDDEPYLAETQFEPIVENAQEEEDEEDYAAETQFAFPVAQAPTQEAKVDREAADEPAEEMTDAIIDSNDPEETIDAKIEQNEGEPVHESMNEVNETMKQFGEVVEGATADQPAAEPSELHANTKNAISKGDGLKPSSPKRSEQFVSMPHKSNSPKRPVYDNAGLLSDDAIHRIQNGAMMTGSVGGANLGMSMFRGGTDRDLLTSIALQSTPNLPEAAMSHKSSEETTVVNDKGAKDFSSNVDHRKSAKTEGNLNSSDMNTNENGSAKRPSRSNNKSPARKPAIPSEVFVETPVKERRSSRSANRSSTSQRPKRSRRSLATPPSDSNEEVRIMFTGIDVSSKQKKMIQSIGAELVESLEKASTVTHVIATDGKSKLRRTPKLMICLCNTSNILSLDWLEQSAAQKQILNPKDFLVLGDKAAEATYNFIMKDTIENGKEARMNGGVLAGYSIYICKNVADNHAPPMKALQLIIEAAGGQLIKSLSKVEDPTKTIILTSDPSTDAQLSEKGVGRIADSGGKVLTTSWLFHTMITQSFSSHVSKSSTPDEKPSRSKRKAVEQSSAPEPSSRKRRSRRS